MGGAFPGVGADCESGAHVAAKLAADVLRSDSLGSTTAYSSACTSVGDSSLRSETIGSTPSSNWLSIEDTSAVHASSRTVAEDPLRSSPLRAEWGQSHEYRESSSSIAGKFAHFKEKIQSKRWS